uniref:Cystatin-B n=1 Tax=Sphaeramia orbicularis TaxID=375764 RepID=A0A673BZB3_9TELE
MVGAPEASKEANETIQCICDEVKSQAEERTNQTYDVFKAVTFTQQVVAGTLYKIKVSVGANKHITITVLCRLPCHPGRRYEVTESSFTKNSL